VLSLTVHPLFWSDPPVDIHPLTTNEVFRHPFYDTKKFWYRKKISSRAHAHTQCAGGQRAVFVPWWYTKQGGKNRPWYQKVLRGTKTRSGFPVLFIKIPTLPVGCWGGGKGQSWDLGVPNFACVRDMTLKIEMQIGTHRISDNPSTIPGEVSVEVRETRISDLGHAKSY
jgi:hypothetical protein